MLKESFKVSHLLDQLVIKHVLILKHSLLSQTLTEPLIGVRHLPDRGRGGAVVGIVLAAALGAVTTIQP